MGLLVAVLGLLSPSLAPTAHAAGETPTLCTYKVHDSPSPGWLMTPSQGTSQGSGTITCVGALDGKQLAAKPGPFTWVYSYGSSDVPAGGNTCALGGVHGTWQVSLPTMDGASIILSGPFIAVASLLGGELHGRFGRHPVEMLLSAYPEPNHLNQDCISNPAGDDEVIGGGTVG